MPSGEINVNPVSKCLPGKQMPTGRVQVPGEYFFFNHVKGEYMPARDVNAYKESTSARRVQAP